MVVLLKIIAEKNKFYIKSIDFVVINLFFYICPGADDKIYPIQHGELAGST
jgi:hypothetical protein